ncbi:MAG TPA: TonB-dependent receptor [Blastocatellia bacterium]|nr:TonB-dependent receptor [Blastocatellia bacterium]
MRKQAILAAILVSSLLAPALAQSTAAIQGTVTDPSGAVVAGARVTVRSPATGVERTTQTDESGIYQIAALPVGVYRVEVQAQGFGPQVASDLTPQVSQTAVQNFQLRVGGVTQEVNVAADAQVVETTTITVGQVINQKTVQEIPLNGRHFVDLGLLIPGSVTPPQNGFLTAPLRGQGSFAFNTAGNREDTVNFMINGVNLNDQLQNQITFQPSINTVQEFKVDNSTFSAEYGRNSGAIVNIATRAGTNEFHGEAFEFLRNEKLDARNFFDRTKPPFKRNQFGGALGGPILSDRLFFFASYEGLRQRQGLTLNSGVLTADQRARATDPTVRQLLDFIPLANTTVNGAPRYLSSGTAPVNLDQGTIDMTATLGANDRLHGYYALQQDLRGEPNLQLNTIPSFGDTRQSRRQIFTLNETHTFGPSMVNEARLGFNRINITFTPNAQLNPADFGINNGVNQPIGLPQIVVNDIGLNFGGPMGFPQGRADTTVVFSDTLSYLRGRHSFKFGGEFRRFYNNNFTLDTGQFTFTTAENFIAGNANAFQITLGDRASSIATGALGFFAQDSFKLRPNLTLEMGLRYDWNMTPSERYDRFVVFDQATASLVQVGTGGTDLIYKQNNKNFQPRFGIAWDPWGDGKTSVRGAYAILVDQPVTNIVTPTSSNPPLATPLTFTGAIRFDNAAIVAGTAGLAPSSVNPDFDNAYVQSWNLNVQRELTPSLGVQVGYFGSKGTHLRISRNINQFINGVRPYLRLSADSPIRPGAALGNITEIGSGGNSSYNALWATANQRLSRGLQFSASYTWSKSIDYNSLNSQNVVVEDSYNIRNDRGLSDYDARHRFVVNFLYELPFRGNRLVEGWQLSSIVQLQTGNPVNIVTNLPALTGVTNTPRPDLIGDLRVLESPNRWFENTVCDPRQSCPAGTVFALPVTGSALRFGTLGRNVLIGPGFSNVDFSVLKNTRITEAVRVQFRAEFFDLFNHANFGQPGRIAQVNSSAFGVITNTRFPTGDSGSSRQVQFALKLVF